MSRWFRHYAGMMRDDKLVRAAVASKQPVERVVWIWGAILESAAEINDGGRYDLDPAEVAYFLRADEADVHAVLDALGRCGRVASSTVVHWGDRQFDSDRSASRQAAYRERKRSHGGNGDGGQASSDAGITSPSRHGDAPETETELETEAEKQAAQQDAARAKRTKADLDALEAELREAAGLENEPSPALLDLSPIVTLLDKGYDLAGDILPKLRAAKARNKRGRAWGYYVPAITEGHAANQAMPEKPKASTGPPQIWVTEDDPRWTDLCARWKAEKGKPQFARGSRNEAGIGAHFPAEWAATN